jgi:hypothetical protein
VPADKFRASSLARERSGYGLSTVVACELALTIPVGAPRDALVEPKVESCGGYCDMSESKSDCCQCLELRWVLGVSRFFSSLFKGSSCRANSSEWVEVELKTYSRADLARMRIFTKFAAGASGPRKWAI